MKITQIFILFAILSLTFLIAGCTGIDSGGNATGAAAKGEVRNTTGEIEPSWVDIPVTDVRTGKISTIIDLAGRGKPLIIHTFAVWCPACSLQLKETKALVEENPGAYEVLGIDIDPREDLALVRNHVEKNNFSGTFVISPPEMTRSLIETLGRQVIQSLPQTIIVTNASVVYIGDGAFPKERLKTIITEIEKQFGNASTGDQPNRS